MSDASKNSPELVKSQEQLRESLSALIDGEANEFEMHRVLERLGEDESLRETALGYQRIGQTIRHERNAFSGIDLSASISAAIADEPAPQLDSTNDRQSSTVKKGGWVANLGRLAVAASVAAATVIGVQTWNVVNRSDTGNGSELAAITAPATVPTGTLPSADMFGARGLQAGFGVSQSSMTPEQMNRARGYADQVAQTRFRAYMLEHAEQVTARNGQGVMPFVRAASFEMTPQPVE